jgi:hypothetical protein
MDKRVSDQRIRAVHLSRELEASEPTLLKVGIDVWTVQRNSKRECKEDQVDFLSLTSLSLSLLMMKLSMMMHDRGGFWKVQKKSSCCACVRCAVWRLLMTTQIRRKPPMKSHNTRKQRRRKNGRTTVSYRLEGIFKANATYS